jgi:hypothetical protein
MVIYALLSFFLILQGIIFLSMALSCQTVGPLEYVNGDGTCKTTYITGGKSYCRVDFTPAKTIVRPHVYLDIKNFYSSHRNYVKSIDRKQLRGKELPEDSSGCGPVERVSDLFDW